MRNNTNFDFLFVSLNLLTETISVMTRFEAEELLKRLFGFHKFFDLNLKISYYKIGAEVIAPLVIAKTVGGDI